MAYTVYNFQDNNDVKKIAEKSQFSVVEWQRDLSVSPWSAQTAWFSSEMNVRRRQLIANLDGRTGVTLQAGAMQWTVGSVQSTTGVKGAGDLMGKMFRGAVSQDSMIKPEYTGTGMLVCEPTWQHLLLVDLAEWATPSCLMTGCSSHVIAPFRIRCSAVRICLPPWRAMRACLTCASTARACLRLSRLAR